MTTEIEFIDLMLAKKAKQIDINTKNDYKTFQFSNLSSIFIRTYQNCYCIAMISNSEHFIIKTEEYKDFNETSNFFYNLLRDNNKIEPIVLLKTKRKNGK